MRHLLLIFLCFGIAFSASDVLAQQKAKKRKANKRQIELTATAARQAVIEEPKPVEEIDSFAIAEFFHYQEQRERCQEYESYLIEKTLHACAELPVILPTPVTAPVIAECPEERIELTPGNYVSAKWFNSFPHFAIWDNRNVNPYKIESAQFKDTVKLQLFCEEKGTRWSAPINDTEVNSKFGFRRYRYHYGIDLDLEVGDAVLAAFDGIVRITGYNRRGYGFYVVLRHENGLETVYGHLSKIEVKVGQEVKAGEQIALGGNTGRSTGPHLHFETRYMGMPFDPSHIFDFAGEQVTVRDFTLTKSTFGWAEEDTEVIYHRVRSGDCLSKIATRYGSSVNRLCKLNKISTRTMLRPGQRLRVK